MPLARSIILRSSSSLRASSSSRASRAKALKRLIAMSRIGFTRSLLQPVDDIGRDAGFHRRLDRGAVRAVDEHGDRPFTARDSWNMFSSMSRLGFSRSMTMTSGLISAICARDAGDVVDDGHTLMAGLAQPRLDDRGADAVLVDDQDGERLRPMPPFCAARAIVQCGMVTGSLLIAAQAADRGNDFARHTAPNTSPSGPRPKAADIPG